ncbi:TatD family hydrolase [Macrococcus equi]|uniref:TatD family hydrolase n=1 Tax=Macrococcus equi TaxID=3395462 RepID=UPI0039BE1887
MYDAHIHLDRYPEAEQQEIILQEQIDGLIAVAMDSKSAQSLIKLNQYDKVHIALGFHPEQQINEHEINHILSLIDKHHTEIIGIGEVGLPQYLKREHSNLDVLQYIDVLERFIIKAKEYNLPVILHAVYDDTLIALELLKKHNINKAHFHWFKASDEELQQLLQTHYMVSVTPDILHNPKTRKVVSHFPINRLMIETDGPWTHDGFKPHHINDQLSAIIKEIAYIKSIPIHTVKEVVAENTVRFYNL